MVQRPPKLFLYDVTSSYLEEHAMPLGRLGIIVTGRKASSRLLWGYWRILKVFLYR